MSKQNTRWSKVKPMRSCMAHADTELEVTLKTQVKEN